MNKKWKDSQKAKYLAFRTRLLCRAFEEEKTIIGRWKLAGELFAEVGIQQAALSLAGQPEKPLVGQPMNPSRKLIGR